MKKIYQITIVLICLSILLVSAFFSDDTLNESDDNTTESDESYEEIEDYDELNFDEEKSSSSLDNWVGEYTFSEIMDSDQDVLMVMDYYVKIYKEDNQYYGEVRQVGQNCWIENKTKVIGNSEWISLVMDECMNEKSYFQSLKGCVYISFRTDGEKIYTYWGLCESLLKENRESGREYFVKNSLTHDNAKIVEIEEVNGESKITFKYKYGDGVFYGVIYDNIYPKYELDIHDRVGIKTIDLDGDGIEEIVIKVNAIGNTISDRCGTLHIIKLNENGYEEILNQNTNWETPDGGYIIGLIIQNDCLYYESGWKESTENGTTIYTRTYQLIIVDGEIQSVEKNLDIDDAIEW